MSKPSEEVVRMIAEIEQHDGMQVLLGEVDEQIKYYEQRIQGIDMLRLVQDGKRLEEAAAEIIGYQSRIEGLRYIKTRIQFYKIQNKQNNI